jgi:iron complex transport system permease protein
MTRRRSPHLTAGRLTTVLSVLGLVALGSIVASTLIGPVPASLGIALGPGGAATADWAILFSARLPRVLLAAVVGGALATAGTALQGLLHNPLADPHVLGVSGGAAVGGIVALALGADPVSATVPLAAFAGALATIAFIDGAARAGGRATPHAVLLIGVVWNAIAAALIMLVNVLASYVQAQGVLFWIMGALTTQSYQLVGVAAGYALVGVTWLLWYAQDLNALTSGDEGAQQLGVDVERTRRWVFVAAALLVAAAVAVSGIIGFVGLIVPHSLRLLFGADHRLLLPASFLGGAIFLIWADTLARTVLGVAELPVGVVTALIGGPVFVWLLRRSLVRETVG